VSFHSRPVVLCREANGCRVHGRYPVEYYNGSALPDGLLDFTAQLPKGVMEKKLGGLRSEGSANLEGMKMGMSRRQSELMGKRMRGGELD
jgi:hypothetical protein